MILHKGRTSASPTLKLLADERPRAQPAEHVREWVSRHLPDGPKPPIYRPINYVRIVTITTIVLGCITFLSAAWPYVLPIIQNRNLWAAISLITILLFTSGHMFNHIRKVPYVAGNGKGGISYFAGGFSNQFGLETQIVAAMCKVSATPLDIARSTKRAQTEFSPSQQSHLRSKCHGWSMPKASRWLSYCGEVSCFCSTVFS